MRTRGDLRLIDLLMTVGQNGHAEYTRRYAGGTDFGADRLAARSLGGHEVPVGRGVVRQADAISTFEERIGFDGDLVAERCADRRDAMTPDVTAAGRRDVPRGDEVLVVHRVVDDFGVAVHTHVCVDGRRRQHISARRGDAGAGRDLSRSLRRVDDEKLLLSRVVGHCRQ